MFRASTGSSIALTRARGSPTTIETSGTQLSIGLSGAATSAGLPPPFARALLLGAVPHPNMPGAHPLHLRQRVRRIGPMPRGRLRPTRLAGRAVSKEPLNSYYISIWLWGVLPNPMLGGLRRSCDREEGGAGAWRPAVQYGPGRTVRRERNPALDRNGAGGKTGTQIQWIGDLG
jgi:hypothetical protein